MINQGLGGGRLFLVFNIDKTVTDCNCFAPQNNSLYFAVVKRFFKKIFSKISHAGRCRRSEEENIRVQRNLILWQCGKIFTRFCGYSPRIRLTFTKIWGKIVVHNQWIETGLSVIACKNMVTLVLTRSRRGSWRHGCGSIFLSARKFGGRQ